jgi:hypothetical protein
LSVLSPTRKQYRIPALFIDDFCKNLNLEETFIKDKVVNSLRMVLTKLDYDAKFQEIKTDLATMFLPLLPGVSRLTCSPAHSVMALNQTPLSHISQMVAEIEVISGMEIKIKRSVLISMLWVLKHANPLLLTAWYVLAAPPCSQRITLICRVGSCRWGERDEFLTDFVQMLELCVTSFPVCAA